MATNSVPTAPHGWRHERSRSIGAKSFTDLKGWQETYALTLRLQEMTGTFPPAEKYAMVDQTMRAVDSIGSNIAEGFGRRTPRDKVHFYTMAVRDIGEAMRSVKSVSKMLRSLIDRIVREDFR